jgi:chromosome segregation ATPase
MKAFLELENVGGFRGKKRFELAGGAVNEVMAPNAMGKTTIIRGLAAVLSMPLTHDEMIGEGKRQGVLRESIKNIYEKDASVRLQYDGYEEVWRMGSDGSIIQLPAHGDERFILAGMLTQEARTIRQLVEGNADFSWVPRLLSWANRYATCEEIVDSELSDVELEISSIMRRQEGLAEKNLRLQEKRQEKAELEKQRDEFAQRLDEKKREHIKRMKDLDSQLDSKRQKISEYEAGIANLEREIKWLESQLESNAENIREIEKQLQKIDLESTRREVHKEVSRIDEQIAGLESQLAGLNAQKSTFADAKAILVQRGEEEGTCPVCEASTITRNFLDEKISALNLKIIGIEQAISTLSGERARWMQKEATERRQIDALTKAKMGLERERKDRISRKSRLEITLRATRESLREAQVEQSSIDRERAELEKETEKWAREIHEALQKIEKALKAASSTIAEEMRKIQEDSFTEVRGRQASLDLALKWYEEYRDKLSDLREYLDEKRYEHEIKAIARFNSTVKRVMSDLGFTEFDQIALDQDDKQLKVFREGFVRQSIESLCTSERYSIAIVLQIALKETYLPDIPFFIVDEVLVSYDKEREERVLDYLSDLARDNSLYVVVTRLAETATGDIVVKVR